MRKSFSIISVENHKFKAILKHQSKTLQGGLRLMDGVPILRSSAEALQQCNGSAQVLGALFEEIHPL